MNSRVVQRSDAVDSRAAYPYRQYYAACCRRIDLWCDEIVQLLAGDLTDPLQFEGLEAAAELRAHLQRSEVPLPLLRQLLEQLSYAIAAGVMTPLSKPEAFAEEIEAVVVGRRSKKRICDLDEGFIDYLFGEGRTQ
jgi:hypothetical protein